MKPRDSGNRAMGEGWVYVSHGITFAVVVTLSALGGVWLDRRLGTMPLATLVGTIGGTAWVGVWLFAKLRGGKGPTEPPAG
ncbi:MAG: AtpZ/AtpI family protein [Gemmatimonadetes bacterium]|nr:AtpZ/AtpI family protein [Gemmatimonadota bacterium]